MSSKFLKNDDLSSISGGMKNPVAGLSRDEAERKAKSLGKNGKNMGSWNSQSALDFMKWWASSNNQSLSEEDLKKYDSDEWFRE